MKKYILILLVLLFVFSLNKICKGQGYWIPIGPGYKTSGVRSFFVDTISQSLYLTGNYGNGDYCFIYRYHNGKWDTLGYFDGWPRCATVWNGELYVGGGFENINSAPAKYIAKWDGSSWSNVGDGFNATVKNLKVINNVLYAMGFFDNSGVTPVNGLAKWNGTAWVDVYNLPNVFPNDQSISDIASYKGAFYVGGLFPSDSLHSIMKYENGYWGKVNEGIRGGYAEAIEKMLVYKDELYVVGFFTRVAGSAGTAIQRWNGVEWKGVGGEVNLQYNNYEHIYDATVYNNELWIAGIFVLAGGVPASCIAKWNGSEWCGLNGIQEGGSAVTFFQDTLYFGCGKKVIQNGHTDTLWCLATYNGNFSGDTCGVINNSISENNNQKPEITVYPNPCNNKIFINISENAPKIKSIIIFDILGRQVLSYDYKFSGNGIIEINLPSIPPGLYFLNILSANNVISCKFIKE